MGDGPKDRLEPSRGSRRRTPLGSNRPSSSPGVVPGGRIELPTPAFSGPRSTGELPRHRHKRRFYGAHAQESNGPLILVNGAARHGGGKSGSRLARFSNAQCRHLRVRGAPTTLVRVV